MKLVLFYTRRWRHSFGSDSVRYYPARKSRCLVCYGVAAQTLAEILAQIMVTVYVRLYVCFLEVLTPSGS